MIYIEGLGYVEEPTSVVMPSSQVKTQETGGTSFDDVLNSITSSSSGTTYTLKQIFQEAASTYGVDEKLLEAVAYRESGFNANATSSAGAQGIMQLMPSTASSLGVTDSYDAYQNIMGGAKLLKQLSDSYNGDLTLTLAAYNAGAGAVKRAGGVPSTSVQNYVTSVLSLYESGVNVPDTTVTTKAASESNNTENSTNNSSNNTAASTVNSTASSSAAAATTVTGSSSGTTYIDADTLEAALTSVLGSQSSTSVSSASELAAQVMAALGGTNTSYGISSDWTSQEYQLMLQYYTNMLNTISTFGDTDDDDDDYGESSLADLYQLGVQQKLGIDTTNTSTTSTATASAIAQAAKAYAAGNSLLDL
jgi:hypothetical protein